MSAALNIEVPDPQPVSARSEEIKAALDKHQVIFVCAKANFGNAAHLTKIALHGAWLVPLSQAQAQAQAQAQWPSGIARQTHRHTAGLEVIRPVIAHLAVTSCSYKRSTLSVWNLSEIARQESTG